MNLTITTTTEQEIAMQPIKEAGQEVKQFSVPGMVRDLIVDYLHALKESAPTVWAMSVDKASRQLVTVYSREQAEELAEFIVGVREWASLAGVFADAARKSNSLRHSLRIANELAEYAGVELKQPVKATRADGTATRDELPTEAVVGLEIGTEIMVVRHVTRYGLDLIEKFPAKVKGVAANGDYWLTSLRDGTCRACRPTEVVVTNNKKVKV
jgi:hypothetical protein